jgi:hypothetical protein
VPNFFGLSKEYIQDVYEVHHQMIFHGNWRFKDVYTLPVGLRNWFYRRLYRQLEEDNEQAKKESRR